MPKTIIVAGVGQDNLGHAIVESLLQAHCNVIMLARTQQILEAHYTHYQTQLVHTKQLQFHSVDLSQQDAVIKLMKTVLNENTQINGLINTTGKWMGSQPIHSVCAETILTSITQNMLPMVNLTSALLSANPGNPLSIVDLAGATSSVRSLPTAVPDYFTFWSGKRLLYSYLHCLGMDSQQNKLSVYQYIIDGLLNNERTRRLSAGIAATQFISQQQIANHVVTLLNTSSYGEHHEYRVTHAGIQQTELTEI